MKYYFKLFLIIIISFIFIPNVAAKEEVYIEEISLDSKSETCIKSDVNFNGLNVSFDIKFQTLNDFAKYKIIINNSSSEDYELDLKNNSISDYISYEYDSEDNIIKANDNKIIYLTLKYSKSIPEELVENESFVETNNFIINLSNNKDESNIINNPNTSINYLLFIIIFVLLIVSLIIYKYTNNKKYLNLFIISLIIIPVGTYALKKLEIKVESKVEIEVKPTTLIPGPDFNVLLKTLAGNDNATIKTYDENIIEFKRSFELPEDAIATSKISTDESSYDAIAWFDNGTIYWYSEATRIYLSTNSLRMFSGITEVVSLEVKYFDTSKVTDMSFMFYCCAKLEHLDLSNFDTSNVTDMTFMLGCLYSLLEVDVSNFDTSSVLYMSSMFASSTSLKKLDLSNFDTSNVINMSWMFTGYNRPTNTNFPLKPMELTEILGLENFDTSNVTDMSCMFTGCANLTTLDLNSFDTSKVTNMTYMFSNCIMLENIYVGNKWNIDSVNFSINMFGGCFKLPNYDANVVDKTKAFAGDGGYLTLK